MRALIVLVGSLGHNTLDTVNISGLAGKYSQILDVEIRVERGLTCRLQVDNLGALAFIVEHEERRLVHATCAVGVCARERESIRILALEAALIVRLADVDQRLHLLTDMVIWQRNNSANLCELSSHEALVSQLFSRHLDGFSSWFRRIFRKVVANLGSIVNSHTE